MIFSLNAQDIQRDSLIKSEGKVDFPNKYAFQFNFIGLNVSYLQNFGKGFIGKITAGPDYGLITEQLTNQTTLIPNYQLLIDFRFHPFLRQRIEKGKKLNNFPGFYTSAFSRFVLNRNIPDYLIPYHTIIALTGGYRAPIGKIFFFDIQAGPGLMYANRAKEYVVGPNLRVGLGLSFTKF